MTTVSGVRSMSSGWSNVTGGVYVHGLPSGLPCGAYDTRRVDRRGRAPAARAAGCRTAPVRRSRCENPWRPPDTRHVADRHCALSASMPLGGVLGEPEADVRPHLRAEVAELLHRLVRAGAQQLVGPVGATARSAARARSWPRPPPDRGWPPRCPTSSPRTPARPRPRPGRSPGSRRCARRCGRAAGVGLHGRRPGARRPAARCATRAQHDVAHAAANQFVDDDTRLCRRWVHDYSLSAPPAKNSSAAAFTTCGFSMKPRWPVSGISR